jgi:hypothetical protein
LPSAEREELRRRVGCVTPGRGWRKHSEALHLGQNIRDCRLPQAGVAPQHAKPARQAAYLDVPNYPSGTMSLLLNDCVGLQAQTVISHGCAQESAMTSA